MTAVDTTTGEVLDHPEPTLAELEQVIEKGLESFVDVGSALLAIKAGKRYREAGFSSFEDYCQRRWEISRGYGYRLVLAAATVEGLQRELSPMGDIPMPESERQVRPLTRLPEDERADAWNEAVEQAQSEDRSPTAADVEQAVERRAPTAKQAHDDLQSSSETTWADVVAVYPAASGVPAHQREGLRRGFVQLQTMTGPEKVKREAAFLNAIDTALATPEELAERRANAEVRPITCPTCRQPWGGKQ